MINFSKNEKWAEGYAVEGAIEVVVSIEGETQTIRLEVLRSFKTGRYSTRAYCQRHGLLQPARSPEPEELPEVIEAAGPAPLDVQLWVDLHPTLQLTNEASADAALERALEFLQERCD